MLEARTIATNKKTANFGYLLGIAKFKACRLTEQIVTNDKKKRVILESVKKVTASASQ